jgi:hypothetical protein
MPTPDQIKSAIDEQITNKVSAYSISNVDVGERMKDLAELSNPIQFASTSARIAYLTNPNARPFQLCDDLYDGNKYFINKTGTDWVLVASNAPKIEILYFSNQSNVVVAWDATRKAKFGDAGSFVVELINNDGKYRVQYGLEILPDDIDNTTQYTIDLGGNSETGRVIIK